MNANTGLPADYRRMISFALPWPESPFVMVTWHLFPRGLDTCLQCRKLGDTVRLGHCNWPAKSWGCRKERLGPVSEVGCLASKFWKPSWACAGCNFGNGVLLSTDWLWHGERWFSNPSSFYEESINLFLWISFQIRVIPNKNILNCSLDFFLYQYSQKYLMYSWILWYQTLQKQTLRTSAGMTVK